MRIALISDIHFGSLSTTCELAIHGEPLQIGEIQNAIPLFQGLTDVLEEEQPEYLFVTGDLTSSGSPLEFKYCQQKIFELGHDIGINESNIILCLGNHDMDWRISEIANTYKHKPSVTYSDDDKAYIDSNYHKLSYFWPEKESNISQNYLHKYNTPLTGVIEYDNCIIFVLNSSHLCTNDQEFKHGCLTDTQLTWFKGVAKTYEQSKKVKIVLLHHHPCNYPYPLTGLDISTLEEGGELIQICGELGIDLVLHGHRHHPNAITKDETNWKKPVTYICSGSLSVNPTHRLHGSIPNTFHLIDYESCDKIILKNYYYKPASGWTLIKDNCPETPVDGIMLLGKIINDDDAIRHIKNLPINQPIKYRSLNEDLMYVSHNKLNELINNIYSNDHEINGTFPNDVFIFKPQGGEDDA